MDITSSQPAIQVGGNGMDGFGGGFGMMFLAFLAIMGMGGGMFGNRGPMGPVPVATGDQAPVSSAQFQTGMNMQNLADQNRDILGATNNVYHDLTANLDNFFKFLNLFFGKAFCEAVTHCNHSIVCITEALRSVSIDPVCIEGVIFTIREILFDIIADKLVAP